MNHWKISSIGIIVSLWIVLLCLQGCGVRSPSRDMPEMYIEVEPPRPKPHRLARIMLDPGHGGKDSGCASTRDGYEEKIFTLSTGCLVQQTLHQLGYEVLLTRHRDQYLTLSHRAEIANQQGVDLFISLHYNYAQSEEANGVEVFVYKEEQKPERERIVQSRRLAQTVLTSITNETQARSRGVKVANFAVLRETHMPAILIEGGFLSNRAERQKLRDPAYLKRLSDSIARGIDQYWRAQKNCPRRELNARPVA